MPILRALRATLIGWHGPSRALAILQPSANMRAEAAIGSRGLVRNVQQKRNAYLSIGDIAERTGTTVETIRYYEKVGLLPRVERTSGNQRAYTQAHADRLAFIRHSREFGFPLEAVRTLLSLADTPGCPCDQADAIAREHLEAVRRRMARLKALETELARIVEDCRHGRVAECRVIEVLADHTHAHCLANDHGGTGL